MARILVAVVVAVGDRGVSLRRVAQGECGRRVAVLAVARRGPAVVDPDVPHAAIERIAGVVVRQRLFRPPVLPDDKATRGGVEVVIDSEPHLELPVHGDGYDALPVGEPHGPPLPVTEDRRRGAEILVGVGGVQVAGIPIVASCTPEEVQLVGACAIGIVGTNRQLALRKLDTEILRRSVGVDAATDHQAALALVWNRCYVKFYDAIAVPCHVLGGVVVKDQRFCTCAEVQYVRVLVEDLLRHAELRRPEVRHALPPSGRI